MRHLIKTSSFTSKFLKTGLRALRRNKGQVKPSSQSYSYPAVFDKKSPEFVKKGLIDKGIGNGNMAGVTKNPVQEMATGTNEAVSSLHGSLVDKIKGKVSNARRSVRAYTMNKTNKKAIRGITAMHESAERTVSKKFPASALGSSYGHHSVTGVVGRAEHNNLIKKEFSGKLKGTKKFMKDVRSTRGETDVLKSYTPTNQKGVTVNYGDSSSPRMNRSLALRMQAKEIGVPINTGSKEIKKNIRILKKQQDSDVRAVHGLN